MAHHAICHLRATVMARVRMTLLVLWPPSSSSPCCHKVGEDEDASSVLSSGRGEEEGWAKVRPRRGEVGEGEEGGVGGGPSTTMCH